ncbi:TlpA family protein disulfide reductase [Planctomyces sp. SH-PL62]|uniref:TlpA family protein disulfide reductase n=1 Tax=Planctomyces sp. SH-PL62 TaxID=1636152 RepID=UPI00078C68A3|nr:TlpA disulfide reductase family protein [Planctomyces sp. SH-PL62]AMV37424.1 Thiol-disulfide oxidoreductase ResA [Planctomyces sp. SH-PL62]
MSTFAPLLRLAVLLATLGTPLDEPRPEEPPLGERIGALKQRFETREEAFTVELRAANSLDEKARQQKITDENEAFQRDWFAMMDELRALIRAHPADPATLDGLIVLTDTMRSYLDPDLVRIVSEHFRNDPRMGKLCAALATREDMTGLLGEVAGNHPERAVRGQATYALTICHRYAADESFGAQGQTEAARKARLDRANAEFERVVAEFPDVDSADGDFKLADKAKAELARIANLPNLKVGKIAPEIVGEDLDGRPLKLSDHRGKVVVVCFWGTWCGPCMAMVPHERELVARLKAEPFALLGVNSDEADDREKARQATRDKEMTWPSWWDGGFRGGIQTAYDVRHWPTVYILDSAGVIRGVDVRGEALDKAVDELLAEMKKAAANVP